MHDHTVAYLHFVFILVSVYNTNFFVCICAPCLRYVSESVQYHLYRSSRRYRVPPAIPTVLLEWYSQNPRNRFYERERKKNSNNISAQSILQLMRIGNDIVVDDTAAT